MKSLKKSLSDAADSAFSFAREFAPDFHVLAWILAFVFGAAMITTSIRNEELAEISEKWLRNAEKAAIHLDIKDPGNEVAAKILDEYEQDFITLYGQDD